MAEHDGHRRRTGERVLGEVARLSAQVGEVFAAMLPSDTTEKSESDAGKRADDSLNG